jgi:acetyl-CoA C-acetyltransferase
MGDTKQAVIISAARTPTGKFQGSLKPFSAPELGAIAIKEAVKRAGVEPSKIDEVIMGCVVQAGSDRPGKAGRIESWLATRSLRVDREHGLRVGPARGSFGGTIGPTW